MPITEPREARSRETKSFTRTKSFTWVFARMNRVAEGFTREDGANIRTVQELLGHKCMKMAMIYLHVKKDDSMVSPVDSL